MIIKLILICLSNSFFNFFIKMKNEKRTVFRFPFFYENEKRMKVLKIQRKNLLNMKMVVSYLNFVFFIEVKAKFKYRILNFVFQFIKTQNSTLGTRILVLGFCFAWLNNRKETFAFKRFWSWLHLFQFFPQRLCVYIDNVVLN